MASDVDNLTVGGELDVLRASADVYVAAHRLGPKGRCGPCARRTRSRRARSCRRRSSPCDRPRAARPERRLQPERVRVAGDRGQHSRQRVARRRSPTSWSVSRATTAPTCRRMPREDLATRARVPRNLSESAAAIPPAKAAALSTTPTTIAPVPRRRVRRILATALDLAHGTEDTPRGARLNRARAIAHSPAGARAADPPRDSRDEHATTWPGRADRRRSIDRAGGHTAGPRDRGNLLIILFGRDGYIPRASTARRGRALGGS
jgi:hypothetical protein